MSTPFIHVTTVAIDEMILRYAQESKFGYFISETEKDLLVKELVAFIVTSRELRGAGDRLMQKQAQPEAPKKRPGGAGAAVRNF